MTKLMVIALMVFCFTEISVGQGTTIGDEIDNFNDYYERDYRRHPRFFDDDDDFLDETIMEEDAFLKDVDVPLPAQSDNIIENDVAVPLPAQPDNIIENVSVDDDAAEDTFADPHGKTKHNHAKATKLPENNKPVVDSRCDFISGDGINTGFKRLKDQNRSACITSCLELKKGKNIINGVSVSANKNFGECWCIDGMSGRDKNTFYESCFLNSTATTTIQPQTTQRQTTHQQSTQPENTQRPTTRQQSSQPENTQRPTTHQHSTRPTEQTATKGPTVNPGTGTGTGTGVVTLEYLKMIIRMRHAHTVKQLLHNMAQLHYLKTILTAQLHAFYSELHKYFPLEYLIMERSHLLHSVNKALFVASGFLQKLSVHRHDYSSDPMERRFLDHQRSYKRGYSSTSSYVGVLRLYTISQIQARMKHLLTQRGQLLISLKHQFIALRTHFPLQYSIFQVTMALKEIHKALQEDALLLIKMKSQHRH